MPIKTSVWRVGAQPVCLAEASITSEQFLEEMIVAAPQMLSDEWMLIGRQESTEFGGRIDLLAIAPDASLVLIELKRDRTPREVVAQTLDYAQWVEKLRADEIIAIYGRFAPGKNLAVEFQKYFGADLIEDELNQSHQIIIVASSLDDSTERIVTYLSERDIAINVLCFQVFANGTEQLLARTWLLDPVQTQVNAAALPTDSNEPWNGEFYGSFGESENRSWDEAVQLGFFCGGGGNWYSRTLRLLKPGDRIWAKVPGAGFVGVGKVLGYAEPASSFRVDTPSGKKPIMDVVSKASYHSQFLNDPERTEYFVPVKWLQTVPVGEAIQEVGMFGNQNTVCKPTTQKWRSTVDRLKLRFPRFNTDNARQQ